MSKFSINPMKRIKNVRFENKEQKTTIALKL